MSAESASILVAVRNEMDRVLESSVQSLLAQDHAGVEVVAVDDHSEDGSRAALEEMAARDRRLHVLAASTATRGKRPCLAQAAAATRGTWLLFTDADARLAPDALRRGIALAARDRLDAVSLLPHTRAVGFWEQVALASTAWIAYEGTHLRRCHRDDAPVGLAAAGPYLLVRRTAYDAVGGYAAMRENVLVDVALARRLRAGGFRYRYLASGGVVDTRMYRSLVEIWWGFGKNAAVALGGTGRALAATLGGAALIAGPLALTVSAAINGNGAATLAALAGWIAMALVQHRAAGFMGTRLRVLPLLSAPLGALLWLAITIHSSLRTRAGDVRWKGRTLPVLE